MTNDEKFLRACEYAIHRMIIDGSYGVLLGVHSNEPVMVDYVDVLDWIGTKLDKENEL